MRPPRPRRYVARSTLDLLRLVFRYSYGREAYVLRIVGNHVGPVLREDRRIGQAPYAGPERRLTDVDGRIPLDAALR